MALTMVMLDDPDPVSSEEALKTLDAKHVKGEFGSMKRCDLLTDPELLPPNGITVCGHHLGVQEKEKPPNVWSRDVELDLLPKDLCKFFGLTTLGSVDFVARQAISRVE